MRRGDARQLAMDEAKKGGNPTLAVAYAIMYLADVTKDGKDNGA